MEMNDGGGLLIPASVKATDDDERNADSPLTMCSGHEALNGHGGWTTTSDGTWTAPASVKTTDGGDVLMSRSW